MDVGFGLHCRELGTLCFPEPADLAYHKQRVKGPEIRWGLEARQSSNHGEVVGKVNLIPEAYTCCRSLLTSHNIRLNAPKRLTAIHKTLNADPKLLYPESLDSAV